MLFILQPPSAPRHPSRQREGSLTGANPIMCSTGLEECPMFHPGAHAAAMAVCLGLAGPAVAQSSVYIPAILELSCACAVSGTNFRDGIVMATRQLNTSGGQRERM